MKYVDTNGVFFCIPLVLAEYGFFLSHSFYHYFFALCDVPIPSFLLSIFFLAK